MLVVEDDPPTRIALLNLLFDLLPDFRVRAVGTLEEARALLAEEAPTDLLLDLRLPDGTGGALLREIRQAPGPQPRVVVVTGASDSAANAVEARLFRPDAWLTKPYDVDRLVEALKG